MTKRIVEIDDTLPEILESLQSDFRDIVTTWLDDNHDTSSGEPDIPDWGNDLDYSGTVHELIDGAVPIYTAEIDGLWYLYGSEFESAFDDAGIGDKNDEDWPSGWKPAAIYCYLEQELAEWYSDNGEDIVAEWWAENRPAVVAIQSRERGEFEGLVVSDTSEVPEDYSGAVLHINDHGNATLYSAEDGELEEIDAVV
jgi:hypothetical protein